MDHLTAMAIFARVVEARSFSGAARQLGLSKSAISKQIGRLEDRLGARLLNRTTRRLALTEIGASFYEHCARMLAEAEEAERLVAAQLVAPRGILKVNAPMSFGVLHIAPAIADFLGRHPEMRIDMTLTDSFVNLIDDGVDVAVRITGELPDSTLVARRLAPVRRVVCAAPSYFARAGVPRTPEDLAHHNCLNYTLLTSHNEWRFGGPGAQRMVRVTGSLQSNNGDALKAAALAGLGLILTPTFIVGPELQSGRLRTCLDDFVDTSMAINAVYPHRRHLSANVRAFVDFLADRFAPVPWWDRSVPQ